MLMHADRILHGMNMISCSLKDALTITFDAQLRAITELRDLLKQWDDPSQFTTVFPPRPEPKLKLKDRRKRHKTCIPLTPPLPRVTKPTLAAQSPRVNLPGVAAPTPRVETSQPQKVDLQEAVYRRTRSHQYPQLPMKTYLIARRTRSHKANLVSPSHASVWRYPYNFLLEWTMHLMDEETGQSLEY